MKSRPSGSTPAPGTSRPAAYKTQIEPQLEYWYKHYHGTLDGDAAITQQINAIKAQAQATLFPPANFTIAPAPTPAELAHHAYTSGDPKTLGLEDKEYILANGSDADATGLWALLKGQQTPVPGNVISDPATVLKITVTTAASPKPKEFVVKLTNSVACSAVPPAPSELKIKDAQDYILANGVKADTDAMGDVLTETPAHLHKIAIEPSVTAINVAVTQDAKDNHVADFIVNLKDPLSCKEAPAAGSMLGFQPAVELDATYDTYTHTRGGRYDCRVRADRAERRIRAAGEEGGSRCTIRSSQPRDTTRACNSTTVMEPCMGLHEPTSFWEFGRAIRIGGSPFFFASRCPSSESLLQQWLLHAVVVYSPSMMRWMAEARPVLRSQVTSAAHILGFPLAASNLPGMPVRNLCSTSSFSTPMMLS